MVSLLLASVGLVLAVASSSPVAAQNTTVQTTKGAISGVVVGDDDSVFAYWGIPLAAPPVGNLRFASPQEPEAWSGVLACDEPKPACPAGFIQNLIGLVANGVDEDCLYLNVYTPATSRNLTDLPVLLWYYGGAFVLGDGWSGGMYDGTYIVGSKDVIIVTTNYRLGSFGFLVTEASNGNYAVEDQRLALYWVRDNIAAFGGDPNKVTIYGESAGAMSVGVHMVSDLSKGLFQQALMQSNPFGLHYKTREFALAMGSKLASNFDCPSDDLTCLRAIPWSELALNDGLYGNAGRSQLLGDLLTWGPTVDGKNLVDQPLELFASGQAVDVPLILGTNSHEAVLFQDIIDIVLDVVGLVVGRNLSIEMNEAVYRVVITTVFKDSALKVLREYPPLPNDAPNYNQFFQMITEFLFSCPSRNAANNFVKYSSSPAYTYRFSHAPDFLPRVGNYMQCFDDKVCHALELPFTWHGIASRFFSPEEEALSQEMISYWTSFAQGNVNLDGPQVQWQQFTATNQNFINFDLPIGQGTWEVDTCDFWDSIGYIY